MKTLSFPGGLLCLKIERVNTQLPRLALVRQLYPSRKLADVPAAVAEVLQNAPWRGRIRPGMRVGVAAGSRGIVNYPLIVRMTCDVLKSLGADVFIFPCMGSHGGGTSEGQRHVLREMGITEETAGVPILSDAEPVYVGKSPNHGIDVHMDRNAFAADGFVLINRVKPHTDFAGTIESGLMKMMAMGIAKHKGAQIYHRFAIRGLRHEIAIREAATTVLATGKCLGGMAILEDAFHQTARVVAVDPSELPGREEELLATVKSWLPKLQVDDLDLLIMDEMGKEISGAGFDTKVVNRSVVGVDNGWPGVTRIERIYVRDLSAHSYGNAVGMGMTEGISRRLYEKIDIAPTQVNALTASTPRNVRLPIVFDTDQKGVETLLATAGLNDFREAKIGWIKNTLEVATLAVSHNLLPELQSKIDCEIFLPDFELEFDADGAAISPFATAGAH